MYHHYYARLYILPTTIIDMVFWMSSLFFLRFCPFLLFLVRLPPVYILHPFNQYYVRKKVSPITFWIAWIVGSEWKNTDKLL